jgi:hypothetical protein
MAMDESIATVVARHDEQIENLRGWQKTQNGTLIRIDQKVDRLLYWLMGEMAALILLVIGIFVKR